MAEDISVSEYRRVLPRDITVKGKPTTAIEIHVKESPTEAKGISGIRRFFQRFHPAYRPTQIVGETKKDPYNPKYDERFDPLRATISRVSEKILQQAGVTKDQDETRNILALSLLKESMILQMLEQKGIAGIPRVARNPAGRPLSTSGFVSGSVNQEIDLEPGYLHTSLGLEKIEGENWLQHDFKSGQELGEAALKAATTLAAIEAEGILHNDVKPANLMIDGKGDVYVIDFNAAEIMENGLIVPSLRTSDYSAPEKIYDAQNLPVSAASDIYSLALTIATCAGHNVKNLMNSDSHAEDAKEGFIQDMREGKGKFRLNDKMIRFIDINLSTIAAERCQHFGDVVELLKAVNDDTVSKEGFARIVQLRAGKKT